ncbi:YafY family protein [Iodobacter sp.]|uniref:helix-turn-helix transcriptional regulator n=1 Tax=Iodobacter sp. TaxID=1915058 RepID=UPI0025E6D02B|nr:YafY family protein [Iodobacter sp.]
MSRAERLLTLMQKLRLYHYPVSGAILAGELGISLRTLYRDIASLQSQGAQIEGEAGLGFVLRPGFTLPPLMFSVEEIEALALGAKWVASRTDARLGTAASHALSKIAAVLPTELRLELDTAALLIGPSQQPNDSDEILGLIREAIRHECKLELHYLDAQGKQSTRIIWPCALAFFDYARVVIAWCEARQAFRHFRVDRIKSLLSQEQRYPKRRQALLKAWRVAEGITEQRH